MSIASTYSTRTDIERDVDSQLITQNVTTLNKEHCVEIISKAILDQSISTLENILTIVDDWKLINLVIEGLLKIVLPESITHVITALKPIVDTGNITPIFILIKRYPDKIYEIINVLISILPYALTKDQFVIMT